MKINNNVQKLNTSFGSLSNLSEKAVKYIQDADKITSVGQRLIIGATAMVIQPMIDLKNKDVDKKTREQSALRSIARNGVGAATGIAVRAATIEAAKRLTKEGGFLDFVVTDENVEKMSKQGKRVAKSLAEATPKQIQSYAATMGTILGLFVMLFTNFLVDIPLINAAQNKMDNLYHKIKKDDQAPVKEKQNEEAVNGSSK